MLILVDSGCQNHKARSFDLDGLSALFVTTLVASLPEDGQSHTYTCDHGHCHRLSFHFQKEGEIRCASEIGGLQPGSWLAFPTAAEFCGYLC
jgi:hypothetical protein